MRAVLRRSPPGRWPVLSRDQGVELVGPFAVDRLADDVRMSGVTRELLDLVHRVPAHGPGRPPFEPGLVGVRAHRVGVSGPDRCREQLGGPVELGDEGLGGVVLADSLRDRKSTRLNSSHVAISYAVFCLEKKK